MRLKAHGVCNITSAYVFWLELRSLDHTCCWTNNFSLGNLQRFARSVSWRICAHFYLLPDLPPRDVDDKATTLHCFKANGQCSWWQFYWRNSSARRLLQKCAMCVRKMSQRSRNNILAAFSRKNWKDREVKDGDQVEIFMEQTIPMEKNKTVWGLIIYRYKQSMHWVICACVRARQQSKIGSTSTRNKQIKKM